MTTIAYKDGILAADSLCTNDHGVREGTNSKIFTLRDKSIIGIAGDPCLGLLFIKRLESGPKMVNEPWPPFPLGKRDGSAIHVFPDGRVIQYFNIAEPDAFAASVEAPFFACGSGQDLAKGAMAYGADAIEAVKVAIRLDSNSGGPVQALFLKKSGRVKIIECAFDGLK